MSRIPPAGPDRASACGLHCKVSIILICSKIFHQNFMTAIFSQNRQYAIILKIQITLIIISKVLGNMLQFVIYSVTYLLIY